MKRLAALLILCLLSCTSDWAKTDQGFAAHLSLLDLRRDQRSAVASDATVDVRKQAISQEFAEALPVLVEKAVRAVLVCAGLGDAASLVDACRIPNLGEKADLPGGNP